MAFLIKILIFFVLFRLIRFVLKGLFANRFAQTAKTQNSARPAQKESGDVYEAEFREVDPEEKSKE